MTSKTHMRLPHSQPPPVSRLTTSDASSRILSSMSPPPLGLDLDRGFVLGREPTKLETPK